MTPARGRRAPSGGAQPAGRTGEEGPGGRARQGTAAPRPPGSGGAYSPYRYFTCRQKSRSIHLSNSVMLVALPAFIRKQHWPVGDQS